MEIEIPSPTVFLRQSPITSPVLPAPVANSEKSAKTRNLSHAKPPSKPKIVPPVTQGGIVKPKQSKSRNGCMTCKKKRLKCDETKPTCEQCRRRNVDCEGYKKDFKWRTFEETTQNSRAARAKKSGATVGDPFEQQDLPQDQPFDSASTSFDPKSASTDDLQDAFASATVALRTTPPRNPNKPHEAPSRRRTPPEFAPLPILDPALSPSQFELPSPSISPLRGIKPRELGSHVAHREAGSPPSSKTNDLVLLGKDRQQNAITHQMPPSRSPNLVHESSSINDPLDDFILDSDIDNQDIVLDLDLTGLSEATQAHWHLGRIPSPNASSIPNSPRSPGSAANLLMPEDLMQIYSLQTCGILSVKDSPGENPWRTIMWSLARECQPLSHALNAMTALHAATSFPDMRLAGMTEIAMAVHKLSAQMGRLRVEETLATSLVLAIAEGWDERVLTGIQHLHAAKALINDAMTQVRRESRTATLSQGEMTRLKFLCNTFIYQEVIARLTTLEEPPRHPDTEDILYTFNDFSGKSVLEVDPRMGCAAELFPKIGRAAQIIQEARRRPSNSLTIVAKANEIREDLLSWQPPHVQFVERPEDPMSDVTHSVHTAEAYRIAALLYLHQAVPEMAMEESAHSLAKTILTLLAGVPRSSSTMIIQIFPLFVGSCEMTAEEDREWVTSRWLQMMQRMDTVNVKSCWEIVQDVWARRDAFEATKLHRRPKTGFQVSDLSTGFMRPPLLRRGHSQNGIDEDFSFDLDDMPPQLFGGDSAAIRRRKTFESFGAASKDFMPYMHRRGPSNKIEPEYNVRGRLHWLSAMAERGWEVFLG